MAAFSFLTQASRSCGEWPEPAHSVEKHVLADVEFCPVTTPQAPLLSGFSRMLRCRKGLGQFPEVLGGYGEEEWTASLPRPR